jgi:ABC-type multidrug transport system fused ATPase/permease subunit
MRTWRRKIRNRRLIGQVEAVLSTFGVLQRTSKFWSCLNNGTACIYVWKLLTVLKNSTNSDIKALNGISLSIEAGQKIGILRRTGRYIICSPILKSLSLY